MKRISYLSVMMMIAWMTQAQTSLSFCTFVNNQTTECIFDNTKFITSPDSTHATLYMMLRSNSVFGTDLITYKVYSLDHNGKEVFLRSVSQSVQNDWKNAWQPSSFVSPGKYFIKVYSDAAGLNMIASRGFEFFNN